MFKLHHLCQFPKAHSTFAVHEKSSPNLIRYHFRTQMSPAYVWFDHEPKKPHHGTNGKTKGI